MQPVCLVIGAGAGIGSNVARRFASEGYHAVLCRRTDEEGLKKSVTSIEREGGSASGFLLNAVEPDSIEDRIADVEANIGPIEVVVYNRTQTRADAWTSQHGGKSRTTPAAAVEGAETVFVCVGNDDDLRSVVSGESGALAAASSRAIPADAVV